MAVPIEPVSPLSQQTRSCVLELRSISYADRHSFAEGYVLINTVVSESGITVHFLVHHPCGAMAIKIMAMFKFVPGEFVEPRVLTGPILSAIHKKSPLQMQGAFFMDGGETGIRTLGGYKPTPVFKTGAFNRSAISPDSSRRVEGR